MNVYFIESPVESHGGADLIHLLITINNSVPVL